MSSRGTLASRPHPGIPGRAPTGPPTPTRHPHPVPPRAGRGPFARGGLTVGDSVPGDGAGLLSGSSAQRTEQGTVDPAQHRARVVSAQHGDFVTEDQDLDVLGCVGAGEQYQPAQHAGEQQVHESEGARSTRWPSTPWSEAVSQFSAPTRYLVFRSFLALSLVRGVLPAAEADDVGAVHDDDEERTCRPGWSSRWRLGRHAAGSGRGRVPVRRRHGGVWLRARENPAGAESQPGRAGTGGPTSRPWVI
jgi:hypothetical protein